MINPSTNHISKSQLLIILARIPCKSRCLGTSQNETNPSHGETTYGDYLGSKSTLSSNCRTGYTILTRLLGGLQNCSSIHDITITSYPRERRVFQFHDTTLFLFLILLIGRQSAAWWLGSSCRSASDHGMIAVSEARDINMSPSIVWLPVWRRQKFPTNTVNPTHKLSSGSNHDLKQRGRGKFQKSLTVFAVVRGRVITQHEASDVSLLSPIHLWFVIKHIPFPNKVYPCNMHIRTSAQSV